MIVKRGDARLGGAVVGLAQVAVDARQRRRVDDPGVDLVAGLGAVAPVGGGVARRGEGALEVDLDDGVPLRLGHVREHAVAEDAGVVDEDVEAAEGVDRLLDQRARRRPSRRCRRCWRPPRRPAASISSTTAWAGPVDAPVPSMAPPRSFTTTLAPWAARSIACSRPMPLPAPVTMQIRPSQSLAMAPDLARRADAREMNDVRAKIGNLAPPRPPRSPGPSAGD